MADWINTTTQNRRLTTTIPGDWTHYATQPNITKSDSIVSIILDLYSSSLYAELYIEAPPDDVWTYPQDARSADLERIGGDFQRALIGLYESEDSPVKAGG